MYYKITGWGPLIRNNGDVLAHHGVILIIWQVGSEQAGVALSGAPVILQSELNGKLQIR